MAFTANILLVDVMGSTKKSGHGQPLLNQIQICVEYLEIRKFVLKKNLIDFSTNIQLYYGNIGKSAQKSGVFDAIFNFFVVHDLESILVLKTTKFIVSMKFLIFRHPTNP